MKASIIIPIFNEENNINNCINSLIPQLTKEHELILINNNSTDKTHQILNEIKLKNKYKNITILNESKPSSYAARNKGIKHSTGDYLIFIDGDCIASKNYLKLILEPFKNNRIKLVGGPIQATNTNTRLQKYCNEFCHRQEDYYNNMMFVTSNMAIRKSDLDNNLKFNQNLKSGGDLDLCTKIIKTPKQLAYSKDATVRHNYETSILKFIKRNIKYGIGNAKIKDQNNHTIHIKSMTYSQLAKKHNYMFIIFRIIQDISFQLGKQIGKINFI